MNISEMTYPWYCLVNDDELQQGDILEGCPVFFPSPDLTLNSLEADFNLEVSVKWTRRNVIIISQTCDMVKGREKITEVLLCLVWDQSQHTDGHLSTPKGMEEARKGQLHRHHVLNECKLANTEREFRVVDFRYIYTLPIGYCRKFAAETQNRIRLLPPYREHLSQSFARFFMRVGLPTDIPPFR
jgi:hypothetical protein